MSAQSMATASDIREGDRRRWVILSLLVVAQFMVVLDVAIVNVALPTIKNDLHFSRRRPPVGDHRLRDRVRRRPPARRPDGRPARPPAHLHGRNGRVHDLLAARRPRLVVGLADRLPRPAGARRRAARAGGTLDPDHDVQGGTRPQRRARNLGRSLRKRGRRRRPARWRADQRTQLVLDLLHQRPRRRARARAQPGAPEGEPRRPRPPPLRHGRRRVDHRRPDAARVRAHAREPARLGHDRDGRAPRRLGRARRRVPRDRDALSRAAASACASSACAR